MIFKCQKYYYNLYLLIWLVYRHLCEIHKIKSEHTHNTSLWIPFSPITECGCQSGGAAFIIQSSAPIVDRRVDRDGPHAGGITVTVAVVIAAAIAWCPHVDAAFSSTPLKHHPVKQKHIKVLIFIEFSKVNWWLRNREFNLTYLLYI